MKIFDNIKMICKARNMSVAAVASALGVTANTLYRQLRSDGVKLSTLQRVANAIGCDVGEFFTGPTATPAGTRQQAHDTVTCPHCGKPLRIRVEAGE